MGIEESADKAAEHRIDISRGQEAKRFLESKFWLEILEPTLALLQSHADNNCRYSPSLSAKSVDEIAARLAYYSGASDSFGEIVKQLNIMIERGRQAAEELKRMETRK